MSRVVLTVAIVVAFVCGFWVLPCRASCTATITVAHDEHITLDVNGADLHNVLRLLTEEAGLNLIIDGATNPPVTLRLLDVAISEAFEMVICAYGLTAEQHGDIVWVRPP